MLRLVGQITFESISPCSVTSQQDSWELAVSEVDKLVIEALAPPQPRDNYHALWRNRAVVYFDSREECRRLVAKHRGQRVVVTTEVWRYDWPSCDGDAFGYKLAFKSLARVKVPKVRKRERQRRLRC